LVQTETNRNQSVSVVFQLVFFAKPPKKIFGLFWCFGQVSKQPKQTEIMVWGIKKVQAAQCRARPLALTER
jgi:hypothetical protein